MNKKPLYAGSFYPSDPEELNRLLDSYKEPKKVKYKSKAIIVPHAAYLYSGHAAMSAFQCFEPSESIFIIAPSHNENFTNIAMPEYTYFDTPLGSVEVNNRLIKELAEKYPCIVSDVPFEKEYAIEIQLPFLQNLLLPQKQNAIDFVKNLNKIGRKLRIVPILVGKCDYHLIADIITEYWEKGSFIISSDLSHFYNQDMCRQIDNYTAAIIETGKLDCFQKEQACGLIGIKGLIEFANNNEASMIRTEMYNSGDIDKETDRVVGYGGWFLYPDSKNHFIEKYYKDYIFKIVRESILYAINQEEYVPEHVPSALLEYGASFVTIKIGGKLRGCVGSIYPTKPLILDLVDNAKNAGFSDSRFIPLTIDELENIEISVSLLSMLEHISFKDEKDLLSKIYPYGVIISEQDKRAVYLPSVWEQLPDREIFLNSLKEKAGLPPTYFSRTFEAYRFTTVDLEEYTPRN